MESDNALLFYPGCPLSFPCVLAEEYNAQRNHPCAQTDAGKSVAPNDGARTQREMLQPINFASGQAQYIVQQEMLLREARQYRSGGLCEHAAVNHDEGSRWTAVKPGKKKQRGVVTNSSSSFDSYVPQTER